MKSKQSWVGVGLRPPHIQNILDDKPDVGWFEVHSENYFHLGMPVCQVLSEIREHYPISLHGVGLSLGSTDCLDYHHLGRLKALIDFIQPCFVSEHLSWNRLPNVFLPDLIPIPYHRESLRVFSDNIQRVQDFIQMPLLIENPSSYVEYQSSTLSEPDFLVQLSQKTGAGILLDVNNVYVSCMNHGWDANQYIDAIPPNLVKEIHLAGHSEKTLSSGIRVLIDTHDNNVCEAVWALYHQTIRQMGPIPTLIERDANIPPFNELKSEHDKAVQILNPIWNKQYA